MKNICVICSKAIPDNLESYKIKKKILFKDTDNSNWFAWGKAEICENCINEIRKNINNENI